MEYLKYQLGFDLLFEINDRIYYERELSVVNSPFTCLATPFLKTGASICIRFHDLEIKNGSFKGCIQIDALLNEFKIAELKIGCFEIDDGKEKIGIFGRFQKFFRNLYWH